MELLKTQAGRIPRIFRWIAEHRARQSAIRELCAMPGWRLRDVGIERGRIPEVVDGLLARKRAMTAAAATNQSREARTGGLDTTVSEAPI